jgi:hypothetical protein
VPQTALIVVTSLSVASATSASMAWLNDSSAGARSRKTVAAAQRTCLISYEGLVQMIPPLDMPVRLYDML